ncbi:hypothetical protein SB444474_2420 [Shigella boydii 4444-74]|uniref:Uncharacterized protein n=1 Tax=Shigella boydii 4444-74 TaxID=766140 RepID=I6E0K1_SHIBO|nr:hypothetical protein SB444474_2420 [Shigella boydii 4444-74]
MSSSSTAFISVNYKFLTDFKNFFIFINPYIQKSLSNKAEHT